MIKFGRLSAIRELERREYPTRVCRQFLWKCACGKSIIAPLQNVRSGNTRSCGCLRREIVGELNRTHGKSKGSLSYYAWKRMRRRCLNPSKKDAPIYRDRGISICQRWNRFEEFFTDMGEPKLGMSLDRINNDIGYSKTNCRWADARTQAGNQRRNKMVVCMGKRMCFSHALQLLNVERSSVGYRIKIKKESHQSVIDSIVNARS